MRTGVITQKIGMTRLFLAGRHAMCPVTVLKLDGCQVVAKRTEEKDGYTAVQLGSGFAKTEERSTRPSAAISRRPKSSPRRSWRNSASTRRTCSMWATCIQADHFVPGQKVDVTGVTIGRGFTGAMKRWNFRGLEASHGVSISHRSLGGTGGRQDPGKTFKNKKMHGHYGVDNVTTQNLEVAKVDVERGLIMIRGAVPGSKGGWVMVRDAVKRPHKDVPMPASVKKRERRCRGCRAAEEAQDGGLSMKTKVLNLDNKAAGEIELNDAIFGLEPRAGSDPARRRLAARQAPRRPAQGADPRRSQSHQEEGLQAEGHRPGAPRRAFRSAVRGRRQGHGPGAAQP